MQSACLRHNFNDGVGLLGPGPLKLVIKKAGNALPDSHYHLIMDFVCGEGHCLYGKISKQEAACVHSGSASDHLLWEYAASNPFALE